VERGVLVGVGKGRRDCSVTNHIARRMLSCNACTSKTEKPRTKCKYGSKCFHKTCPFAHASPSGTVHMAGHEPTSCRDGIRCNKHACQFAHPSKGLQCTALGKDTVDDMMKYVVHILESCSDGSLSARVLARLVNENKKDCSWPAAINLAYGFKKFCIQHADKKITWVEEARGAGKVKLVGTDVISGSPSPASPSPASAACGSGNACTFQTEMPGTKCKYGSKLTQKTCSFPHASPSGTVHIAGHQPTSCRDGIQCNRPTRQFAHPSKAWKSREQDSDLDDINKMDCANSSKLSAEATNLARYSRLILEVGPEVMASIFRASYQEEYRKPWTSCSGHSFLHKEFPDGSNSLWHVGTPYFDTVSAGKCEEWDVSLLCSLLQKVPGYVKGTQAKKAVNTLRSERNQLVHVLQAKKSLSGKDFKKKWDIAVGALNILMDKLLPAEKKELELKIDEIENAQVRESDLERLRKSEMHQAINCIHEKLEKAPTMSQVKRVVEKLVEHKLNESALNQKEQVDLKPLPSDIWLINKKKYQLIKRVGNGGMATVYEGRLIDCASDVITVALKFHANESLARAQQEINILQKLKQVNHDNIVKFIDSGSGESLQQCVIVMEFVQGQSLDYWLEKHHTTGKHVTFDKAQNIIKQLVTGMSEVHIHRIVHRDLKPGNLIFDEITDKLVIVDFGLSKQHNTDPTITGKNDQLGTPLYMSPESIDRDQVVSFPSDVWSIGIVWHEILTSFTPFEPSATASELGGSGSRSKRRTLSKREEGNMVNAIFYHVKPRKLPMLDKVTDVPAAVNSMIAKCLSANKKERYQDAQKLLLDLIEVYEELEREKAEESQKSPSKDVPRPKPFKEYSVGEVFQLVYDISEGFHEIAHEMKVNGINGQYFLDMLAVDDEDMTTSIADGGLGFRKLQLKSVKAAIKKLE